jgi:lipopolysaccharide biosynthesis regulator YciM
LLANNDTRAAAKELQLARHFDAGNVRAYLLLAGLEITRNNLLQALNLLQSVIEHQPVFASEVLPLFREAFAGLSNKTAYLDALQRMSAKADSTAFIIECAMVIAEREGRKSAVAYLYDAAMQRPTLGLLSAVLERSGGEHQQSLALVRQLLDLLKVERPTYRCLHCGFSGQKLHWLCPSCEQWGTIAPLRGIHGD